MKKLLSTLALVGIISTSVSNIAPVFNSQKIQNKSQGLTNKTWKFVERVVEDSCPNGWRGIGIEINLTSLGINNLNDLRSYNRIEVPGIKIELVTTDAIEGDVWGTNKRIGTEDWFRLYEHWVPGIDVFYRGWIDTKADLWINQSTGIFWMRLDYSVAAYARVGGSDIWGPVYINSGTEVVFVA